jgi:transposase-like protein
MTSERKEMDEPCPHCGCYLYQHIEATSEDESGWECTDCGRGWVRDPEQPKRTYDQLTIQDQEYLDYIYEDRSY